MAILKTPPDSRYSRAAILSLEKGCLPILKNVLVNPEFSYVVGSLVIFADVILCMLVIRYVSCKWEGTYSIWTTVMYPSM